MIRLPGSQLSSVWTVLFKKQITQSLFCEGCIQLFMLCFLQIKFKSPLLKNVYNVWFPFQFNKENPKQYTKHKILSKSLNTCTFKEEYGFRVITFSNQI